MERKNKPGLEGAVVGASAALGAPIFEIVSYLAGSEQGMQIMHEIDPAYHVLYHAAAIGLYSTFGACLDVGNRKFLEKIRPNTYRTSQEHDL